jgi:hypothetical protein
LIDGALESTGLMLPSTLQYAGSQVDAAINVADITTAPPVGRPILDAGTFKPVSCLQLGKAGRPPLSPAYVGRPRETSKAATTVWGSQPTREATQMFDHFMHISRGAATEAPTD